MISANPAEKQNILDGSIFTQIAKRKKVKSGF